MSLWRFLSQVRCGRCSCGLFPFGRVMAVWVIVVLCAADTRRCNATESIVVQPVHLQVAATLNEPLVLRLEVTMQDPACVPDLKPTGVWMQREVRRIDSTHYLFLIEPDTTRKGRVDGRVDVVCESGITLCSVPFVGEVKTPIRVSPVRIFLGSLDYGASSLRTLEKRIKLSADAPWRITSVDVAELGDARWEVQNEINGDKELVLRFQEDAFKAKAPFGAFIRRSIRIETDNAVQPEIIVAIEGMLAHNATKRNFNTYVFRGNERWQGRWNTPNIAAAVVGSVALLLLGVGAWLFTYPAKLRRLFRVVSLIICLGGIFAMMLLSRTYSRGGWVAFGAGWVLLMLLMRRQRVILGSAGIIFVGLIGLLPAGLQRAATVGAISDDLSISHRLLVWRGALEMIADHPLLGVGENHFGQFFQTYYQQPWHKDQYSTAINDYLTLAAERGFVPVMLTVGLGVCLTMASLLYMRRYKDVWLAPVIGTLLTLEISSVFSSLGFVPEVGCIYGCGFFILATYCVVRLILERRNLRLATAVPVGKVWPPALAAGCSTVGLGVALIVCADWTRTASCVMSPGGSEKLSSSNWIEYVPGKTVPFKGTFLFLPASDGPLTAFGRQILRPFAEHGWRAVAMDLCMYDQVAAGQVVDALHDAKGPLLILSEGTRARVALAAAARLAARPAPKLVFVDPVFTSSLEECDQSSAPAKALSAAIPGEEWQAFKRDGRTGMETILETCSTSASNTPDAKAGGPCAQPKSVIVAASMRTADHRSDN